MTSIFPVSASAGQEFSGYNFDGESWNLIGNEFNPTVYSGSQPEGGKAGDIWIDSSIDVPAISPETILTINSASSTYLDKVSASTTYATKTELANIDLSSASAAAVAAIVDSAPSTLNTLNELAAALNDDASFATTVTTSLSNKLDISSASTIYLSQTSASTNYATKSNPTFTGTVTSPNINVTTAYQKNGTSLSSIAYADIAVSAQAGENTYLLNLPTGVNSGNFVSINPVSGVNNYLMITGIALGDWSGVQTSSQIRVRCFLGNGVHLEPFTLRVYYRV